jgi:eukaryotic-like serine/threonine-protein kinase
MTLSSGARLGPYEIQSAIGAGGMGEVYKARDTRLDRSVAIKILPAEVSADPDRRARFEREAKTIAGLNHPHICTLHDVGDADGTTYLVMEHLTGETLAQRLEKGPLPLEQALTVATEIADALSVAHRQGVIHRDLKPGNVMLTKTGAKLLDFGLAKLSGHGEHPAAASLASAPTRTAPLTSEGAIVGTLQYMAPEQVEGKSADARTDLWALGAILYEMLTGKHAFEGASAASLIGNIMNAEPPGLATLKPVTPPALDRLVRRCLAKPPDDRPDTAHDVADELRWLREASGIVAVAGVPSGRRRGLRVVLVLAGMLATAVIGAGVMWVVRSAPSPPPLARVNVDLYPAEELNGGGSPAPRIPTPGGSRTALIWSPDGQALVFVGRRGGVQQLYVRRLEAAEARPLSGTDGAQVPALSPDGRSIVFWAGGTIKKVPFGGGLVTDLAAATASPPRGMTSDDRGRVYFGKFEDGRIWQIPPEGEPSPVTTLGDAEIAQVLPSLLPGGRVLLYTVRKRQWSWGDDEIVAQTLATGVRKVLLTNAVDARYVSTGHLVFLRRGVLCAVPFDAERLEVLGKEVPVLDNVTQALTSHSWNDITGAGQFAVATTGTLAWLPSPVIPQSDSVLVTVDRHGQIGPLPARAQSYGGKLRLSPRDGRRLAVMVYSLTGLGLWWYDLSRDRFTPLTVDGEADYPVWLPDGQRLVFQYLKGGRWSLATQPADATVPAQMRLTVRLFPSSITPDGLHVAAAQSGRGGVDIVIATLGGEEVTVRPLFETPYNERWPEFSPGGRWLAYGTDVSGQFEVWVRPYPGPGEAVPVEAGSNPAWSPDGRELFYVSPPDGAGKCHMMVVSFEAGPPPRIGRPRVLFDFDPQNLILDCTPVRCYDVAPDGQRFYAVQRPISPPPPPVTSINLIQNWFEELKAKVPPGR